MSLSRRRVVQRAFGGVIKWARNRNNKAVWGSRAPYADQILFVNPQDILWQFDDVQAQAAHRPDNYMTCGRRTYFYSGTVLDGTWDQYRKPVLSGVQYAACHNHFINGQPWEETGIYDEMERRIAEEGVVDKCRTRQDIIARYAKLDRLYETVEKEGRLRTRHELRRAFSKRESGGIYCHIGHDGQFLRYRAGNHRFAIARLLKLPEIPVHVGVVHSDAVARGVVTAHAQSRLRR
ncbi:MAG: hypothetical protein CSA68_12645 [Rhodobacterales bacterium]|nr:MAG: hypothetical protein CSA68_12645 [Rhodobacterales bacterium]